jgi:putative transposase
LAEAQKVEQEKDELSLGQRLRCKIRYFSDGVILGSRAFVEFHLQRLKEKLGYKRIPTSLNILDPPGLWVFRKLRARASG